MSFRKNILDINPAIETGCIISTLKHNVYKVMRRRGGVVGVSGGIDSAVVLALSARAFGPENVAAIVMPERESDPATKELACGLAYRYGVAPVMEDITSVLESLGCYSRRDEAIQRIFPEYDATDGYKSKISLPKNLLEGNTLNVFSLTIRTPDGQEKEKRLPPWEYFQIVAASNFKQRARMCVLYYHAELRHYAVIGTTNKNEHDQGFFVKYGDGASDIKPITHLFKTQVYQLGKYLDVPESILNRSPTPDTYSYHQTQEEFFFRLPFQTMDLLMYAWQHNISASETGKALGLSEIQVQHAYDDFSRKERSAEYLHL